MKTREIEIFLKVSSVNGGDMLRGRPPEDRV